MQHVNDILGNLSARPKPSNVIPLRPKPAVPPPVRIVDETMCPLCKNAGWTRPDGFDPKICNKVVLIPCPRCIPRLRAQNAATRQVQLVDRLFGGPQIPYRARNWSFTTFPAEGDQNAKSAVEQFVAMHRSATNEQGKRGLFIAGKQGRGKTGLAICALKEFIEAGQLSLFVSVPDLMDRLRAAMFNKDADENPDELLKAVTDVPFLALDDLGVEKPTPYVLERFYLIIDKRLSKGLYTLFTSNLSTKDLEAYWRPSGLQAEAFHPGLRIIERIREYCQGVSIRGGNLRDAGW
jgi:DNA replication protein DnaC